MRLHNLLADITLRFPWLLFAMGAIATGHLLHFNRNWLLTIDLRDEAVHTLAKTGCNLAWHIRNHCDNLFLPLKCFKVCFYDVQIVIINDFRLLWHRFDPKLWLLFSLYRNWDSRLHIFLQQTTLLKSLVSAKRVDRKLLLVSQLVLFHLVSYTFGKFKPFILVILVLGLHGLNSLLLAWTMLS